MYKGKFSVSILRIVSVLFLCVELCSGASSDQIMEALDLTGSKGITLIGQKLVEYEYNYSGFVYDENTGQIKIKRETDTNLWLVQYGNYGARSDFPLCVGVSPVQGNTCLRSGLSNQIIEYNDAKGVKLIFKVSSGGILKFSYMTSVISGALRVFVDGRQIYTWSGYGLDNAWGTLPGDASGIRRNEILHRIPLADGFTEDGYEHEIVFEFFKDAPWYDWNIATNQYVYNPSFVTPQLPNMTNYDLGNPFGREMYYYDMARYWSFQNCAWLDGFSWTPEPYLLQVGVGDLSKPYEITEDEGVFLQNNARGFGHVIRYTLDGSVPTASSPLYTRINDIQMAITPERSCVITAMMFTEKGVAIPESKTSRQVIVRGVKPKLQLKTVLKEGADIQAMEFELSSETSKNHIHYTLDGSTPTAKSALYEGGILSIREPAHLKALSVSEGIEPSEVVDYVIEQAPPQVLDSISVTHDNGLWEEPEPSHIYEDERGLKVTCQSQGDGVQLFYSIDSGDYVQYTGPFVVKATGPSNRSEIVFQNRAMGKLSSELQSITIYKATTKVTVSGEGISSDNISGSSSFNIRFKDGWNSFTMPLGLSASSAQLFMSSVRMFEYDAQSSAYVQALEYVPGRAYWFFRNPKGSYNKFDFYGVHDIVQKQHLPIERWCSYGAVRDDTVPTNVIAWEWQGECYRPVRTFKCGKGYWVYRRR